VGEPKRYTFKAVIIALLGPTGVKSEAIRIVIHALPLPESMIRVPHLL
jgi:hypothetical protein